MVVCFFREDRSEFRVFGGKGGLRFGLFSLHGKLSSGGEAGNLEGSSNIFVRGGTLLDGSVHDMIVSCSVEIVVLMLQVEFVFLPV